MTSGKTLRYEKGSLSVFFIAKTNVGVMNAEVLFTDFRVEHNMPFAASDRSGPLSVARSQKLMHVDVN